MILIQKCFAARGYVTIVCATDGAFGPSRIHGFELYQQKSFSFLVSYD